jgi:hypothetical protein
MAGAEIRIADEISIDLGFLMQSWLISTQKEIDSDNELETIFDFQLHRAQLKFGSHITRWVETLLLTEITEDFDIKMLDAWLRLTLHPWVNLTFGQQDPPVDRPTLTEDGAIMTIERPAMNSKSLTRGTRAAIGFTQGPAYVNTDAGFLSPGSRGPRDTGATLFGSGAVAPPHVHLKYYIGIFDGLNASGEDTFRYTGRLQVNFMDPEPDYYNRSTYLGAKKTIGFGGAVDFQDNVGSVLGETQYTFFTLDFFTELPVGKGTLSTQGGYQNLDLDELKLSSEGYGYYVTVGYLRKKWQPWAAFEFWGDDLFDFGNYWLMRFGLNYYIRGHNLNIKAGFEHFKADLEYDTGTLASPIPLTEKDKTVETFVVGFYAMY